MGLPIWHDPDERTTSKSAIKQDPTACLRSSIRRRPSVHGRRPARLPREPTFPPRFERSPPPPAAFNGLRAARRGEERGVPPISTLLEAANRERSVLPPPPVPEPRNYILSAGADDEQDWQEWETQRRLGQRLQRLRGERRQSRARFARLQRERDEVVRQHDEAVHMRDEARAIGGPIPDGPWVSNRSPTPPANRDDPSQPMHTITLNSGDPLRIIRSPEPMSTRSRPHSRNGSSERRSALPTPPLDMSAPYDRLSAPHGGEGDVGRRVHPLSHAWRAPSPINGLGDRNRSPTPADGWNIMGTTITPDETLPSADSSFASTAASRSFNASGSNSTRVTEPDELTDDSPVDADDLVCTDEDMFSTEVFAEDVYYQEMQTPEGRERIASHQRRRQEEGNRFALAAEPARIDIGFRLIEEALETDDGRQRVLQIRHGTPAQVQHFEDMISASRRVRERRQLRERGTSPLRRPQPERYGEETQNIARQTRRQVHDYFRRFGADSLEPRSASPPPEYEAAVPDVDAGVDATTSRDGPEPHPVSPPSNRSEREVSEMLLDGNAQELDSMRRIVERLAARNDVPEEWWMSMGLNLSRSRPRNRSPRARQSADNNSALNITRSGRIERGNSRL